MWVGVYVTDLLLRDFPSLVLGHRPLSSGLSLFHLLSGGRPPHMVPASTLDVGHHEVLCVCVCVRVLK